MSFFSRQTVDSIVSDIVQKIEHLHAVAEIHKLEAEAHNAAVRDFQRLEDFALKEFSRAKAIAGKLTALVS